MKVNFELNGKRVETDVEPRMTLADCIRDHLRQTGTHLACEHGVCGACTVLLDGRAVKSCTLFAVQADGRELRTIEGVGNTSALHPLQEGFKEKHGLQCGFCTPGMIMSACALLEKKPHPTEEDIRWGISGNLCRCTGYQNIVKAVQYAAEKMSASAPQA